MLGVCSICLFCTCGDNQACVRDNLVTHVGQLEKEQQERMLTTRQCIRYCYSQCDREAKSLPLAPIEIEFVPIQESVDPIEASREY